MWAVVCGLLYFSFNGVLHESGSLSKSNAKDPSTFCPLIQSCVAAIAGRVVMVKIEKISNNFFMVGI